MGCLLAPLALISPRPVLVLLWILSNVLSRAFDSWIIPLLGFFILPWTTLAYAASGTGARGHHVTGLSGSSPPSPSSSTSARMPASFDDPSSDPSTLPHSLENVGDGELRVIMVEVKHRT